MNLSIIDELFDSLTGIETTAFCERNNFFNKRLNCFCLGQRRFNLTVFEQSSSKIAKHRGAMLAISAQLFSMDSVSHGSTP